MSKARPIPEHLRAELARCAHTIWCEVMVEQGWGPGDAFDTDLKIHPALKPFDELSPFLSDLIAHWLDCEEVGKTLLFAVEAAMRDTELPASAVEVGTLVRLTGEEPASPDGADDDLVGRVIECVIDRPKFDRLKLIKVMWPDGEIVEYAPGELIVVSPAT